MSYSLSRIAVLAKKLGISFREAAALCGRKGSRRRRERQCACVAETAAKAAPVPWYMKENC